MIKNKVTLSYWKCNKICETHCVNVNVNKIKKFLDTTGLYNSLHSADKFVSIKVLGLSPKRNLRETYKWGMKLDNFADTVV